MQYHLNGFRPGAPDIAPAMARPWRTAGEMPSEVDVLIVGCGPAGLTLAAQLSAFPDIKTCIVDQKPGPLQVGQADGIKPRTMEIFEAFSFSERVLREAYWHSDVAFWKPDERQRDRIVRDAKQDDAEEGLSEFPHVVLNQARVHDFYLSVMSKSPSRMEPDYAYRFLDHSVDASAEGSSRYPVTVRLERLDPGHEGEVVSIRAGYLVGCDGARSGVRKSLGLSLRGDSANQAWGVMDVLVDTDFPDYRIKSAIHSANGGNILLIPREGGYMVRVYIELDKLDANERIANRNLTAEHLVSAAQRVIRPYSFDVKEIAWWSVYEIGQRLCDQFDDAPEGEGSGHSPRVFIAGDACHTHSPKAGQGMNVSMHDTFNLGWKLASVIQGRSAPAILNTYSPERQVIAEELIEFDREWSTMLSAPPKESSTAAGEGVDPAEFQNYFVRKRRYTAGTATHYRPSIISATPVHQVLAKGFVIGMRFHSAPVVRVADARSVHLGHTIKADGRWRLFAFDSNEAKAGPSARMKALCEYLKNDTSSPIVKYTPADQDIDSVLDVRAVFQRNHRELEVTSLPDMLLPRKGRYNLRDYEKAFCGDPQKGDIFDMRGIDRENGCVVIVRPDQHVANVIPLDAHKELAAFFDGLRTAVQS